MQDIRHCCWESCQPLVANKKNIVRSNSDIMGTIIVGILVVKNPCERGLIEHVKREVVDLA